MNISQIKNRIAKGDYNDSFLMLYGDATTAAKRYSAALDEFFRLFGDRDNIRIFSAPGRTEVGGNHTDHQHGCVLAGSVNLDVIAIVSATDDNMVRIKSAGYPMDEIDVCDLEVKENEKGRASALIRGVLSAFSQNSYKVGGFDAYTTSNVLKGSGLSSSAAFEVLLSNIVNGLYNNHSVDAVTMAKYSQFAEREYFGKPCGLLDQMASSVGGFTYADFFDPQNPIIEKVDINLLDSGHTLCVVDTGGNHANLTQDYADITLECKAVSEALGVEFLRDADESEFYKNIAAIRKSCGDRAVLRAMHFFNENARANAQRQALKDKNFDKFFALVNESGESSFNWLQNVYSPANPKEQGISLALAVTKQFLGDMGACRVHGGGFAGTIQCYIPSDMLASFKAVIEAVFGKNSCVVLSIRPVGGYELKLD